MSASNTKSKCLEALTLLLLLLMLLLLLLLLLLLGRQPEIGQNSSRDIVVSNPNICISIAKASQIIVQGQSVHSSSETTESTQCTQRTQSIQSTHAAESTAGESERGVWMTCTIIYRRRSVRSESSSGGSSSREPNKASVMEGVMASNVGSSRSSRSSGSSSSSSSTIATTTTRARGTSGSQG